MDSVLSDFNSYSENYRRPSCFKATRASRASPGGFAPAPSTQHAAHAHDDSARDCHHQQGCRSPQLAHRTGLIDVQRSHRSDAKAFSRSVPKLFTSHFRQFSQPLHDLRVLG